MVDDQAKAALEDLARRIYLACSSNNHSKLDEYIEHVEDLCCKYKEDQPDNVSSLINYLSNRIQTQYLNPAYQLQFHLQTQLFFAVYCAGGHCDSSSLIQVEILIINLKKVFHGLRSILVASVGVDDVDSPAPAVPPTLTAPHPGHSTVTFIN